MANTGGEVVARGVKLIGESLFLPGSSLILDGDIKGGALHAIGGLAAKALIGPVGWLLVAANSYSQSVSDKSLIEQFKS